MPKVKRLGRPQWEADKEDFLRSLYGGAMTASDVGRELGLASRTSIMKWLAPVPRNRVTKKYDTSDIARKMSEERGTV